MQASISLNISTQSKIAYELLHEPEFDPKFRNEHSYYGTMSGRIKPELIRSINSTGDIFDPSV